MAATTDAVLRTLHPDCPDWERLGPTRADAAIRAAAEAQRVAAEERESAWAGGFNRRTFLAGGLGIGVATLGSQLVTSRVSYADAATPDTGTLVVIFLRGGMDGLSMLVPANDPNLLAARPHIGIQASSLLDFDTARGFGLHPALAPLSPLIKQGMVAAVPAVSTPDLTRSHFQAQDCLERGSSGSGASLTTGWLDRVLEASGPGTTFRGVAVGGTTPRSLSGPANAIAMQSVASLKLQVDPSSTAATRTALHSLYTGIGHPIAEQADLALRALDTATRIQAAQPATPATKYPGGNFSDALQNLAELIKGGAGVRVACIDVGGWDTHTGMGTVDNGDMMRHLGDLAAALAAFTTDIGSDLLARTTVVTMSEFGRRIEENASGGTDHGHGGAVLVLGGGVAPGVHGTWRGVGVPGVEGDVPYWNDYRDVLGEIVQKRVPLTSGTMSSVFPRWKVNPVGVMA